MKISRLLLALLLVFHPGLAVAADRYVSGSGTPTSPYDTWAKAAGGIQQAITGSAAGDRFIIDKTVSEAINAVTTLTFPGTTINPNTIVSVTNTGSPVAPADLSPGAAFSTTINNNLTVVGSFYDNGWGVSAGSGSNTAALLLANNGGSTAVYQVYANTTIGHGAISGGNIIVGSGADATAPTRVDWINTNVSLVSASNGIVVNGGELHWLGGSLVCSTCPTNLFANGLNAWNSGIFEGRDLDLSAMGASKFLVNGSNVAGFGTFSLANVKVAAALGGVFTGTIAANGGTPIDIQVYGSGSTVYNELHPRYAGSVTNDITTFLNSGASNGTTPFSWKVSTINASRLKPLVTPYIVQWVNTTGAHTFTVEIANTGVTLQDLDIYLELEYLGASGNPLGTLTDQVIGGALPNILVSSGTNIPTSAASWTGAGATTTQSLISGSLTINQPGYVLGRVYVTKPSIASTLWINPKLTVN